MYIVYVFIDPVLFMSIHLKGVVVWLTQEPV